MAKTINYQPTKITDIGEIFTVTLTHGTIIYSTIVRVETRRRIYKDEWETFIVDAQGNEYDIRKCQTVVKTTIESK
jgi:hypothetical protein